MAFWRLSVQVPGWDAAQHVWMLLRGASEGFASWWHPTAAAVHACVQLKPGVERADVCLALMAAHCVGYFGSGALAVLDGAGAAATATAAWTTAEPASNGATAVLHGTARWATVDWTPEPQAMELLRAAALPLDPLAWLVVLPKRSRLTTAAKIKAVLVGAGAARVLVQDQVRDGRAVLVAAFSCDAAAACAAARAALAGFGHVAAHALPGAGWEFLAASGQWHGALQLQAHPSAAALATQDREVHRCSSCAVSTVAVAGLGGGEEPRAEEGQGALRKPPGEACAAAALAPLWPAAQRCTDAPVGDRTLPHGAAVAHAVFDDVHGRVVVLWRSAASGAVVVRHRTLSPADAWREVACGAPCFTGDSLSAQLSTDGVTVTLAQRQLGGLLCNVIGAGVYAVSAGALPGVPVWAQCMRGGVTAVMTQAHAGDALCVTVSWFRALRREAACQGAVPKAFQPLALASSRKGIVLLVGGPGGAVALLFDVARSVAEACAVALPFGVSRLLPWGPADGAWLVVDASSSKVATSQDGMQTWTVAGCRVPDTVPHQSLFCMGGGLFGIDVSLGALWTVSPVA